MLLYVVSVAAAVVVALVFYIYVKRLTPTRERLASDLRRLRRVLPVDELSASNFGEDDVRRYYSATTFRDYKLLEWATGCNAMHTELAAADRRLPYRPRHLQQLLYVIAHLGDGAIAGGRTLEVGFGKGSNTVYLASLFPDALFVGLDLVDEHAAHATDYAAATGVAGNTAFAVGDAAAPPAGLLDARFDAIFGIESFCHMDDAKLAAFLKFAAKALLPRGRIVVVDGFRADNYADLDDDVREAMNLAESGFRIARMPSRATWRALAAEHGLEVVSETELTRQALAFWTRGWRVAHTLLRVAPAFLRWYFASNLRRRETGANFASVAMTAYAMALGSANYGVLVLQACRGPNNRQKEPSRRSQ